MPGRFRFAHVAPGTWTLHVTAPGYVPAAIPSVEVGGASSPAVRMSLERGATLHGRAVLPPGVPAEKWSLLFASVGPAGAQGPEDSQPLEEDGTYRRSGFLPGRYRAEIRRRPGDDASGSKGYDYLVLTGDGTISVPSGATEASMDLDFVVGIPIHFMVRDARLPSAWADGEEFDPVRGRASAASSLTIRSSSGAALYACPLVRDAMQDWKFFPPGTYSVSAQLLDEAPDVRSVVLAPGDATAVLEFGHPPVARASVPAAK